MLQSYMAANFCFAYSYSNQVLCRAEDEVDPAVRADDITDLANLEGVRRVLEGFLHLSLHGRVHDQPKCTEWKDG